MVHEKKEPDTAAAEDDAKGEKVLCDAGDGRCLDFDRNRFRKLGSLWSLAGFAASKSLAGIDDRRRAGDHHTHVAISPVGRSSFV